MSETPSTPGVFEQASRRWQYLLDRSSPFPLYRWLIFVAFIGLYALRVYLVNGWYIVTYGLSIFLLNQFIGFLTPQFDPDEDSDLSLPTRESDEFRPFARRVPEFKFWINCTRAVLISFFMTFFEVFDIPVFWPVLVAYFFVLFFITMKRQIAHMIKHKYIPFDIGKKATYGGSKNPKSAK